MDRPFSSSSSRSPSSRYSPPSEYPQSVENASQEPTSSRSSPIQTSNLPRSTPIHSSNLPRSSSIQRSNLHRSSSHSFYPARTSSGRWAMDFFNTAVREDGMGLNPDESFESFMSRHRCLRFYGAWEMCVSESIRNGEDYRLKCTLASKLLRNCVRRT